MTICYAIIDHDSDPSTIAVLSPGRDLKERFLRSMREQFDCEHVAIKTLFDPDQIVRAGASHFTITVSTDIDSFDITLEAHPTVIY